MRASSTFRGLAGTEAGQTHFLSDLGECGVDVTGKVSLVHFDGELDAVALEGFRCRLHREPSVPAVSHRGPTVGHDWCMPTWKPHALAKPHSDQIDLRLGDKVVASVDLADVAAGTEGKVILANGFNWQRYRVLFTNGVELGDLDHRHLSPIGRTAKRLAKKAKRG